MSNCAIERTGGIPSLDELIKERAAEINGFFEEGAVEIPVGLVSVLAYRGWSTSVEGDPKEVGSKVILEDSQSIDRYGLGPRITFEVVRKEYHGGLRVVDATVCLVGERNGVKMEINRAILGNVKSIKLERGNSRDGRSVSQIVLTGPDSELRYNIE